MSEDYSRYAIGMNNMNNKIQNDSYKFDDNKNERVETLKQLLHQTQTGRSTMSSNDQEIWQARIERVIGRLYGKESTELQQIKDAMEQHFIISNRQSKEERNAYFSELANERFDRIEGMLADLILESKSSSGKIDSSNLQRSDNVFIVYGHDEYAALQMEKIIRGFDLNPILLSDQANKGRTLIQKFLEEAKDIAYAFVLFTPDDNVTNQSEEYQQARPNVIFELGWFCGKIGLENVSIVCKKGTKIPSDLDGIMRIDYEFKIEDQYKKIMRELKSSNLI